MTAVCVAGMHRSGTSMLARLLSLCGLDLGAEDELLPPAADNPEGYWEHKRFVELNDLLLTELGGGWDCPPALPPGWLNDARFAQLRERAKALLSQFEGRPLWGWKDPRSSLTLPFWQHAIGQLRVVVCVRHPLEVADSLRRRAMSSSALTLSLWQTYNQRLLEATNTGERVFTHYARYHDDPHEELRRVASFAGLEPSTEILERACSSIRRDRRHFVYDAGHPQDLTVPREVAELYGTLCDLAGVDVGPLAVGPPMASKGMSPAPGPPAEASPWLRATLEHQEKLLTKLAEKVDRLQRDESQQREMLSSLTDVVKRQSHETQSILYSLEARSEVPAGMSAPKDLRYRDMIRRIRDVVRETLHDDATLSVVTKGDEELLNLYGRSARHFPSDADGRYMGYHPKGDTVAILQLEGQRAAGSEYLLIPSTSLWWLDHYRGLRSHLESHYREVIRQDDVCRIYDLTLRPLEAADSGDVVQELIDQLGFGLERDPNVLDWTRDGLFSGLSHVTLIRADQAEVLPYVDGSIDVVAFDDEAKSGEATRVAALAVVRAGGEQVEVERLQLMTEGAPSVSVVIPVHDGLRYTKACLDSLRATVPAAWDVEVVFVDDCSTDATAEFLLDAAAGDSRIRVLRNQHNEGFLKSANAGAAAAKGDLLVFLNNDTVLLPGWLPPLVRTFREFRDVGAVGGRLVYPDGRLQEAGGAVFRDGSAAKIGYGEADIDDPLFTFVRPVDYCSGALLTTSRGLFQRIGGFDERYGFGYYEDVDYCFSVRAAGKTALYQPEATIIHIEGASAGVDLTAGPKRSQVTNQALFVSKWKETLAAHPPRPQTLDVGFWRQQALRTPVGTSS